VESSVNIWCRIAEHIWLGHFESKVDDEDAECYAEASEGNNFRLLSE
jgi:hypothetical protein